MGVVPERVKVVAEVKTVAAGTEGMVEEVLAEAAEAEEAAAGNFY
jgi:hypothetical protein